MLSLRFGLIESGFPTAEVKEEQTLYSDTSAKNLRYLCGKESNSKSTTGYESTKSFNMRHIAVLFLLMTTMQANSQQQNEVELIRASRQASNKAIAAKDLAGVSKHWLDDFVLVRGSGTSVTGKQAVIDVWKETFSKNPKTSFVRNPSEIKVSQSDPTMAWETGEWIGINSYSKGGNYSAMWRKVGGVWMLKAELFVALR